MQTTKRRGNLRRLVNRWVIVPLVFVLLLLGALSGFRAYRIAGLPDIGDPFDVEAFTSVEIPDEENAFVEYRQAVRLLVSMPEFSGEDHDAMMKHDWSAAIDSIRQWVVDNRPALELWRRGTEKPRALYHPPGRWTIVTNLTTVSELREFADLVSLEASRLEFEGHPAAAWGWYRALFRSSRHIGLHGGVIERFVGVALHSAAAEQVVRWSAQPDVNADLLLQALNDAQRIYQLTAAFSDNLKIEYLTIMKEIPRLEKARFAGLDNKASGIRGTISNFLRRNLGRTTFSRPVGRLKMYLNNEPELSRRAIRQLYANWLSQIDLPHAERAGLYSDSEFLFDVRQSARDNKGLLPADEVHRFVLRSILARLIATPVGRFDKAINIERARQAALVVTLAAQLRYREHGRFPERAEELLNQSLSAIPVDPFDSEGGSMRYRHSEEGTAVWSVGVNGTDEGGNFDLNRNGSFRPYDLGYQVETLSLNPNIYAVAEPEVLRT